MWEGTKALLWGHSLLALLEPNLLWERQQTEGPEKGEV